MSLAYVALEWSRPVCCELTVTAVQSTERLQHMLPSRLLGVAGHLDHTGSLGYSD